MEIFYGFGLLGKCEYKGLDSSSFTLLLVRDAINYMLTKALKTFT